MDRKFTYALAVIVICGVIIFAYYDLKPEGHSQPVAKSPVSPTPSPPTNTTTPQKEPVNQTCNVTLKAVGSLSDPYNYTALNYGAFGTDLWNLKSGNGSTVMEYKNRTLFVNSRFCNITTFSDTIIGYPEIGYGYNLEDELFGNAQSAYLSFPMNYSKFRNLNFSSDSNYTFLSLRPGEIPIDFSYDLWLESSPSNGVEPTNTDLEVMIWMYNQDTQPIGTEITTFNSPVIINGTFQMTTWEVWEGRANAWRTVSFVLETPWESSSSNISLNLSRFISDAGNITQTNLSRYFIMGIEMGNEFGNEQYPENISSFAVKYYSFLSDGNEIVLVGDKQ